MTTDKNYRMSKPLKRMLALMREQNRLPEIKRTMIQSEAYALRFRHARRPLGDRNDQESN